MLSAMLTRRLPASIKSQTLALNVATTCRIQITSARTFSSFTYRRNVFPSKHVLTHSRRPTLQSLLPSLRLSSHTASAPLASNSESTSGDALPILSPPPVARWLLLSSALVFAVIVVGGVTRLTESGLSITEWKPVSGMIPPLTTAQWEEEFEKYKATPEFKLCVHSNIIWSCILTFTWVLR